MGLSTVGAMVLAYIVQIAIPFANGSLSGIILLAAVAFCCDFSITVIAIHGVSLRQTIIPKRLLGRANASYRFCTWGVIPFGYLLGGFLGEQIGLRLTLIICTACLPLALPWIFLSPVPRLREMPSENKSDLPPANENEEAVLPK